MKKIVMLILLLPLMFAGQAFCQNNMIIRFKDGSSQTIDMSRVERIEFGSAAAPACWTGSFSGTDISGYGMEINLGEQYGTVVGGYRYYHQGQGKQVRAILVDAAVQGDTLRGRWKQVEGIVAEGQFEWRWLSGERCKAFEGSFDGIQYWRRMTRQ